MPRVDAVREQVEGARNRMMHQAAPTQHGRDGGNRDTLLHAGPHSASRGGEGGGARKKSESCGCTCLTRSCYRQHRSFTDRPASTSAIQHKQQPLLLGCWGDPIAHTSSKMKPTARNLPAVAMNPVGHRELLLIQPWLTHGK